MCKIDLQKIDKKNIFSVPTFFSSDTDAAAASVSDEENSWTLNIIVFFVFGKLSFAGGVETLRLQIGLRMILHLLHTGERTSE